MAYQKQRVCASCLPAMHDLDLNQDDEDWNHVPDSHILGKYFMCLHNVNLPISI